MDSDHSTIVTAVDEHRPSMAVVDLVAAVTDTDPLALAPLYDAIDPDALDSLCTPDACVSSLEFEYGGYTVVVEQSGVDVKISLEPITIGDGSAQEVADSGSSA